MAAHDIHNALAAEFVAKAGRRTQDFAELMVVLESVVLACMLLLKQRDGLSPRVAAGLVEAALQRAMERFAGGAA